MAGPEFTAMIDTLRDTAPSFDGDVVAARRAMEETMAGAPTAAGTTLDIEAVGGEVELELWPEMTHVWHVMTPLVARSAGRGRSDRRVPPRGRHARVAADLTRGRG